MLPNKFGRQPNYGKKNNNAVDKQQPVDSPAELTMTVLERVFKGTFICITNNGGLCAANDNMAMILHNQAHTKGSTPSLKQSDFNTNLDAKKATVRVTIPANTMVKPLQSHALPGKELYECFIDNALGANITAIERSSTIPPISDAQLQQLHVMSPCEVYERVDKPADNNCNTVTFNTILRYVRTAAPRKDSRGGVFYYAIFELPNNPQVTYIIKMTNGPTTEDNQNKFLFPNNNFVLIPGSLVLFINLFMTRNSNKVDDLPQAKKLHVHNSNKTNNKMTNDTFLSNGKTTGFRVLELGKAASSVSSLTKKDMASFVHFGEGCYHPAQVSHATSEYHVTIGNAFVIRDRDNGSIYIAENLQNISSEDGILFQVIDHDLNTDLLNILDRNPEGANIHLQHATFVTGHGDNDDDIHQYFSIDSHSVVTVVDSGPAVEVNAPPQDHTDNNDNDAVAPEPPAHDPALAAPDAKPPTPIKDGQKKTAPKNVSQDPEAPSAKKMKEETHPPSQIKIGKAPPKK